MVLNYSSFMNLLKEHYLSPTSSEVLARGLLEITTGDDSNANFVDSTYLSRIWNGGREMAKDIKDCTTIPKRKKDIYKYFQDVIIKDLVESLKDDFYDKLLSLIANDETILQTKRKKLQTQFESGDETLFLSEVFIYSLNKPNKGYVKKLGFDDGELLEEVDQRSPYVINH